MEFLNSEEFLFYDRKQRRLGASAMGSGTKPLARQRCLLQSFYLLI